MRRPRDTPACFEVEGTPSNIEALADWVMQMDQHGHRIDWDVQMHPGGYYTGWVTVWEGPGPVVPLPPVINEWGDEATDPQIPSLLTGDGE